MEFTIDSLSILVNQFKCVTAIAIHTSETVRGSAIREEEGHLVAGLRAQSDEVPKHIRVLARQIVHVGMRNRKLTRSVQASIY